MRFEHAFADLGGVPRERLSDLQGLGALLLAATNAAGMSPAGPPLLTTGPKGVGSVVPQRGLDIIIRRLGAREVRTDARRRGPVTQPLDSESR